MTDIVVDASAIGSALLHDERGEVGDLVLKLAREMDFVEPFHWPIELMNLILRAWRRNRISSSERDEARDAAAKLIEFADLDGTANPAHAFDLAVAHNMSLYDAAYLALAQHRKLPLLTRDANLLRIAPLENVELLWQP